MNLMSKEQVVFCPCLVGNSKPLACLFIAAIFFSLKASPSHGMACVVAESYPGHVIYLVGQTMVEKYWDSEIVSNKYACSNSVCTSVTRDGYFLMWAFAPDMMMGNFVITPPENIAPGYSSSPQPYSLSCQSS